MESILKLKKIVRKRNTQRCVDQRGERTFSAAIVVIISEIYIVLERMIYIRSHKLGILGPREKLENSEFLEMGKTRKLGILGKTKSWNSRKWGFLSRLKFIHLQEPRIWFCAGTPISILLTVKFRFGNFKPAEMGRGPEFLINISDRGALDQTFCAALISINRYFGKIRLQRTCCLILDLY